MQANPILTFLPLNGDLNGHDRITGPFTAQSSGALRWQPAKNARVNYITNPLAVSGGGVIGTGNAAVSQQYLTNQKILHPITGAVITTASRNTFTTTTGSNNTIYSTNAPREVGQAVVGQILAKGSPSTIGKKVVVLLYDGTILASQLVTITGGWQFLTVATANPSSTGRIPALYLQLQTAVAGDYLDSTAAMVEVGSTPTPFFVPNKWLNLQTGQLGTPNNSASATRLAAWIEEGTTNLFPNPLAASNINNFNAFGTSTRTWDNVTGYFAFGACKVVTTTAAQGGTYMQSAGNLGLVGPRTFTPSVYLRGSGTVQVFARYNYTGGTQLSGTVTTITLSNEWQRVIPAPLTTGTADTISSLGVVVQTSSAQNATFWVTGVQIEEKAYATSLAAGTMGTGFAWAAAAHASATTRTLTRVFLPALNHASSLLGAVLATFRLDPASAGSNRIVNIGSYGSPNGDSIAFYYSSGLQRVRIQGTVGANPVGDASASVAYVQNNWASYYGSWSPTFFKVGPLTGMLSSSPRTGTPYGVWTPANTTIDLFTLVGSTNNRSSGLIEQVALFSRELSDSERSTYNAAIEADIDLWTVYEQTLGKMGRVSPPEPLTLVRTSSD